MKAKGPYLSQGTCVVTFALDKKIRLKVAEIELAFLSVIGAQASNTNISDDAPPIIPRFNIQAGLKQISISQVNAQIDLSFQGQGKSFEEAFPIIRKNFEAFWLGVTKLKSLKEIKSAGFLVAICVPSDRASGDVGKSIFEKHIRNLDFGSPVSAAFQTGFLGLDGNAFLNVAVSQYEIREGEINSGDSRQQNYFQLEDIPISEHGVELKFDVNSKPMAAKKIQPDQNLGPQLINQLRELVNNNISIGLIS